MSICHRILLELFVELNHLFTAAAQNHIETMRKDLSTASLPDKRAETWIELWRQAALLFSLKIVLQLKVQDST